MQQWASVSCISACLIRAGRWTTVGLSALQLEQSFHTVLAFGKSCDQVNICLRLNIYLPSRSISLHTKYDILPRMHGLEHF